MKRLKIETKARFKSILRHTINVFDCIPAFSSCIHVSFRHLGICVLDEMIERFALKGQFEANVLLIQTPEMIFKTKAMKKPAEMAVLGVNNAQLLLSTTITKSKKEEF